MFLFSFPEVLCVDLTAEWLVTENLVRLDTSVCNRAERNKVLNLFRNGFIRFGAENLKLEAQNKYLNWIGLREIKPWSLQIIFSNSILWNKICTSEILKIRLEPVETFESGPNKVGLKKHLSEDLDNLINSCPKLTTLRHMDNYLHLLSDEVLSKLTAITLEDCGKVSLTRIARLCTNLTELKMTLSSRWLNEVEVVDFVRNFPKLTHFSFRFFNDVIYQPMKYEDFVVNQTFPLMIAELCPALTRISFSECAFNIKSVTKLLTLLPKLNHLCLYNTYIDHSNEDGYSAHMLNITDETCNMGRQLQIENCVTGSALDLSELFAVCGGFNFIDLKGSVRYPLTLIDNDFKTIALRNPDLKYFFIFDCGKSFSAVGLNHIVYHSTVRQLNISHCNHIDSTSWNDMFTPPVEPNGTVVVKLPPGMHILKSKLRTISFSEVSQLTTDNITHMLQTCKGIRHVICVNCVCVDDNAVQKYVKKFRKGVTFIGQN